MDKEISESEMNKDRMWTILKYFLIVAVAVVGYYFLKDLIKPKGELSDFHIAIVEKGDIENTLTASGTVVASIEREVNAPVTTEVLRVHKTPGDVVKEGDLILELDQEFTRLTYDQLFDELQLKRNNIDKLKLEYDKNLRELDYRDQIKAIELDELNAQVKDQKRLHEVGGATAEEVEQVQLKLKVSKLEKKMLENELAYRKSVNVNEKKGLELEYTIQENKLAELRRKLRETKVRAPQSGVITWVNQDLGRKVSEGEALVRIANLDKFRVEASSSDRNTNRIDVGMPVKVRINRSDLTGHISTILPAVENNTVKFLVELDDAGSNILRPNIRAEVYIITDSKKDVVRIKNGPAFKGASSQYLFVVSGIKATKIRVNKGLVNSDFVEITGNLNVGDRVIISDTEDYDHLDEFDITPNK